jgi:hypothetical protein
VVSGKFPIFQVGKEKEMRLSKSLESSKVSSCQQGELIEEDSCGSIDHVNEDDDKLKTFTIQEEDRESILMIGGIQVFLPNSPAEANTSIAHEEVVQQESEKEAMETNDFKVNCVYDAGTKEQRKPSETITMIME